MTIELGKKYQARCGYPARVLADDLKGDLPVVAAVDVGDRENAYRYPLNGRFIGDREDNPLDLIEVPETFDLAQWANVYPTFWVTYGTREEADRCAATSRISCKEVHVKGTVGEGLV